MVYPTLNGFFQGSFSKDFPKALASVTLENQNVSKTKKRLPKIYKYDPESVMNRFEGA